AMALAPDGQALAAVLGKQTYLWDLRALLPRIGAEVAGPERSGRAQPSSAVAFSADGKRLATALESDLWLTDVTADPPQTQKLAPEENMRVSLMTFSPDGRTLAVGGPSRTVWVWDVAGKRQWWWITERNKTAQALAFGPSGLTLAIAWNDGSVSLWETATRKLRVVLKVQEADTVCALAFSPDGRTLATATTEGEVALWTLGEKRQRIRLPGTVHGLAWSPESGHLATANANGTVFILRVS